MKPTQALSAVITALALVGMGNAMAQDQLKTQDQLKPQDQLKDKDQLKTQDRDRLQGQDQDRIYGHELMTDQERLEYRARMRAAKTVQERQRIREEHRLLIDARAKERGVQVIHPNPAGMPGAPGKGPGRP